MDFKRKIFFLAILVFSIAVIFGLIYYGGTLRKEEEKLKEIREAPKPADASITNPLGIDIPGQVYYYTGVIRKKSSDSLMFIALAQDNFLEVDQEFIVRIDQNTHFLKYKMPVYLKPGQSPKDFAGNQTQTTFADFNAGDRITVYAQENIKGKTEFVASEIRAVEYD